MEKAIQPLCYGVERSRLETAFHGAFPLEIIKHDDTVQFTCNIASLLSYKDSKHLLDMPNLLLQGVMLQLIQNAAALLCVHYAYCIGSPEIKLVCLKAALGGGGWGEGILQLVFATWDITYCAPQYTEC